MSRLIPPDLKCSDRLKPDTLLLFLSLFQTPHAGQKSSNDRDTHRGGRDDARKLLQLFTGLLNLFSRALPERRRLLCPLCDRPVQLQIRLKN